MHEAWIFARPGAQARVDNLVVTIDGRGPGSPSTLHPMHRVGTRITGAKPRTPRIGKVVCSGRSFLRRMIDLLHAVHPPRQQNPHLAQRLVPGRPGMVAQVSCAMERPPTGHQIILNSQRAHLTSPISGDSLYEYTVASTCRPLSPRPTLHGAPPGQRRHWRSSQVQRGQPSHLPVESSYPLLP